MGSLAKLPRDPYGYRCAVRWAILLEPSAHRWQP
jgi:hypothetical protein